VEAIVKIERALAIAARARIGRHISSDAAAESDGIGTRSSSERLILRWRRHGKQALRQLCEERPAAYLRLILSLVASKRHNSK
jgi:hypothetical protein